MTHDVCEDGAAEEDHVSSSGRVFDADFEFLEARHVSARLLSWSW